MITFSKKVNRRKHDDPPSDNPFYIIYFDGDDVGELYEEKTEGAPVMSAFISEGSKSIHTYEVIRLAVCRNFTEVGAVDIEYV